VANAKEYVIPARDAAAMLAVHPETVRRWARAGKVPARKLIDGDWVFAREDLDRLPVHCVMEPT
jgi:predicted site-specific integrase-resolvase